MVNAVKGLLMGFVVKNTTQLNPTLLKMHSPWIRVCVQHSPVETISKLSALDAILLLSRLAFWSSTVRYVQGESLAA